MTRKAPENTEGQLHDLLVKSSLNLLLWSDVTPVTALSLSAVNGLNWEFGVALSADHFFALVLSSESGKGWLDLDLSHTTSSESKNQVKGGLLLDIVVRESSAILQLLSSEDESLLIWGNTFFILNFGPTKA